jgi:hypothetical protein
MSMAHGSYCSSNFPVDSLHPHESGEDRTDVEMRNDSRHELDYGAGLCLFGYLGSDVAQIILEENVPPTRRIPRTFADIEHSDDDLNPSHSADSSTAQSLASQPA